MPAAPRKNTAKPTSTLLEYTPEQIHALAKAAGMTQGIALGGNVITELAVPSMMQRNWRNSDLLSNAVDELEKRLSPVLLPEATDMAAASPNPPEPDRGPLGNDLNVLASNVERQATRLTALLSRLTL